MTESLAWFKVLGVPAPQGSKTRMPNGAVLEAGSKTGRAKHKAWRTAVAETSQVVADDLPYDGALEVVITFRLPMPASRKKAAQDAGRWPHTVKPDIDKLIRSTLDGMSDGGLIRDDARVYKLAVEAWEVVGWTGAEIGIARQAA